MIFGVSVVGLIFSFLVYNYLNETFGVPSQHNFLGPSGTEWYAFYQAISMLVGIVFGVVFREVKSAHEFQGLITAFLTGLRKREFALSILASPIVFAGYFGATGENPLSVSSLLLAFYNGFFCLKLFETQNT